MLSPVDVLVMSVGGTPIALTREWDLVTVALARERSLDDASERYMNAFASEPRPKVGRAGPVDPAPRWCKLRKTMT